MQRGRGEIPHLHKPWGEWMSWAMVDFQHFQTLGSQGRGNGIEFGVKANDQCISQIRIFNIHSNSAHLVPDCLQSLNVIMDQHILIMFDASHWLRDPKWWKK